MQLKFKHMGTLLVYRVCMQTDRAKDKTETKEALDQMFLNKIWNKVKFTANKYVIFYCDA